MLLARRSIGAAVLGIAAGCSPTLDWREVRTAEGLVALFPCRPKVDSRRLVLAGDAVTMELTSCAAGGLTFAVGRIAAADASRVDAIKHVLRQALFVNLSAPTGSAAPAASEASDSVSVTGAGPDGEPLQARSRIFSRARTVFQVTVMGRRLEPEAVDFFFASIKAPS